MTTRRPFWKWRHRKSIGFCLWPPSTCIWSLKLKFLNKLDLHSGNHATYRVQKRKIQYGRQAAILKKTLLKINRLLPIYIGIVPLKFEVDIQSQSKVRVWSQQASAYGHHQHAYEIWNWNSKANLTYAPETMSSTDRRTDRRTDGRTRWIQYTPLQLRWAGL